METLKNRLLLLTKDTWDAFDIQKYEHVARAKSYEIKKEAILNGCAVRFSPQKINVDKYLKLKGIDRVEEIRLLKIALGQEESER